MDGRRFDDLARALAQHRSRRGLLGVALGGVAASVVGNVTLVSPTSALPTERADPLGTTEAVLTQQARERTGSTDAVNRARPTPASRTSGATSQCESVELLPGYPGYRGYITGLDGIGDHACLDNLQSSYPGFDAARQDSENGKSARRLGLAGLPNEWTWENWMAIEAERGLSATCYSCAIGTAPSRTEPTSIRATPNDPRLLIGGFGTTLALRRLEQGLGGSSSLSDFFPYDHNLRALVGMANPGQHWNATQLLEGYDAVVSGFNTPGGSSYDATVLIDNLLDQGGYAPTAATAPPDDQVFMFLIGIDTVGRFFPSPIRGLLYNELELAVTDWRLETIRSSSAPSFAERLRDTGAFRAF